MRYVIPLLKNSEEELRKDLRDKHVHFTDLQILLMNPEKLVFRVPSRKIIFGGWCDREKGFPGIWFCFGKAVT